ncbi:MAG: ATP-binding protein [Chloroflexales bacterium]|nr:ATP-binding protein [Chloroflexales bacterium]
MNRLWVQLTLGFAVVTTAAVLIVALLADRQVNSQFRLFLAQDRLADSELLDQLAEYYGRTGSWDGVAAVFRNASGSGAAGGMSNRRGRGWGAPTLVLQDSSGQVVYPETAPASLDPRDWDGTLPVVWQDRTVGNLLISLPGRMAAATPEQDFLIQINQALLQAGLLAGGLGVGLGLLIARGLTAPLQRLAGAAQQIAQGDLQQRVASSGTAEIANVARSFNAMAASLQRAEQVRRTMVADIAHELRTPLSVIQGNLQALLDDVYPLEKSEIAVIHNETLLLNRIVSDLRDLAQAEAGQLQFTLQALAVDALVGQVRDVFGDQAAAKGIDLELHVPDGLPPIYADYDRVQQVLHNILANALRYTPTGGRITLQVRETRHAERSMAVQQPADTSNLAHQSPTLIFFEITDTGPGIAPEDLPYVFERFWRADRSRSREQGGSGLGLAIARQLVLAQGGNMGVISEPGQGSWFWFTLPAARDQG